MSTDLSKKFYRNVIRGVFYYSKGRKQACKLNDLVAYVYLKNSRMVQAYRVEPIVKKALNDLRRSGMVEKINGKYRLSNVLAENLQESRHPNKQVLNRQGTSSIRGYQTSNKRSTKSRQRTANPMSPAFDSMEEASAPNPEDDDQSSSDEAEEVVPHQPFKIEIINIEDQSVLERIPPEAVEPAPTTDPTEDSCS